LIAFKYCGTLKNQDKTQERFKKESSLKICQMETELNNYLNAIKSKAKNQKIQMAVPKGKQALKNQNGKCKICGKELKPYLSKYIKDPLTKEISIICSNCAIKIPKR
jgi:hypothetical protein